MAGLPPHHRPRTPHGRVRIITQPASRPVGARGTRATREEPPVVVRGVEIARRTGPVDVLDGEDIIVLTDDENLQYSARDLGYRVSYAKLTAQFLRVTLGTSLHAFFSRSPGDDGRSHYFTERGWTPHPYDARTIRTRNGERRIGNSDNHILFKAGLLISRSSASTVVICTGDGDLADDLARFLVELPKPRRLVTLSLAGSTSQRLDAKRNPYIAQNIELGIDCLRPRAAKRMDRR
ncbi:hypothetical protein HOK31_27085, partial [Candidatus Poribacteria bacterium]|nr:hypothetical protein [Candidatus Poribacteria bacterium]